MDFHSTLTTQHLATAIAVLERIANDPKQDFDLRCDAAKASVILSVHGLGQRVSVRKDEEA